MKKYLISLIKFGIMSFAIYVMVFLLPVTPKAKNYYLNSKVLKDSLLNSVESPRIIFLGGSNTVFGLNSQIVKDSLNLNPINAGVPAPVGLVYMINNLLPKVKENDIIVLIPEYHHYFGGYAYGSYDLTRVLFDIDLSEVKNLDKKQLIRVIKKSPNYFITKFDLSEYFGFNKNSVYSMNIFNKYGDSKKHWKIPSRKFKPTETFKDAFDYSLIEKLKIFNKKASDKGATVYISYPCFEEVSFENNIKNIKKVQQELESSGLTVLGSPYRYKFKTQLMFDTPYHLIKEGVDQRTNYLIEDYLNALK